jgi:hypothetical protein
MEFPDNATILALGPEQVAGHLMAWLNFLEPHIKGQPHVLANTVNTLQSQNRSQNDPETQKAMRVLSASWSWCVREGFLAQVPMGSGSAFFVTDRGRAVRNSSDLDAWRHAALLPRELLHPDVTNAVWGEFILGRYDSAIFNAYRELEIIVRRAGKFTPMDYGDGLMRAAFGKSGKLADPAMLEPERQAEGHLFAGAYGVFRNATGHRKPGLQAKHAVKAIMLASLLATIAEERS